MSIAATVQSQPPTSTRATAELARVTARVLTTMRLTQAGFLVYFVVVWHSWYFADGLHWLGPAGMAAWLVLFRVLVARHGLTPALISADVVVAVAAGAGTAVLTPFPSRGDGASWVFMAMVTSLVVVAVKSSRKCFVVSLTALVVANFAGAATHRPPVLVSTVLIVTIGVLIRLTYRRLSAVAAEADAWLSATFDRRTADAVAARRASDAREQERLIHDTVLNTLTGIGWGGLPDGRVVRSKCARSVAAVEGLLAEVEPRSVDDLVAAVRVAVAVARESGLNVELAIRDGRDDRPATPFRRRLSRLAKRAGYVAGIYVRPVSGPADGSASAGAFELPVEVTSALAAALGEALTNVGRHAGTDRADVSVELRATRVVVAVSDNGVGFDPETAGDNRLGLRESVVGRVVDVGGWADVESAPAHGTTVRLHWNAPDLAALDQVDADSLQEDYDAAVRRAAGTIVLAVPLLSLTPMLAYLDLVESRVLAVGLWVISAVLAVGLRRLAARRPLRRGEAAGLVLVNSAVMAAGGFNVIDPHDAVRIMNWPLALVLPVFTIMVVVSRPTREWILACVVETAAVLVIGLGVAGTGSLELARTGAALYGLWVVQFLAAAFGPVLRASATTTAFAATSDVELASRQGAAAAIRGDRLARVRDLEERFLPLLRGVANARVDPDDPGVRRQCANQAGVLRRLLASGAGGSSSGLAELERPVEAAEARGVTVEVQLHGDARGLPAAVRRRMAATVTEALAGVATGSVTLTVLCSTHEGTVYVTFPLPLGAESGPGRLPAPPPVLRPVDPVDDPGIAVSTDVEDGVACVEVHWESPAA